MSGVAPLRVVTLGYLWRVARAARAAGHDVHAGLEPGRSRTEEARAALSREGIPVFDVPAVDDALSRRLAEADLLLVGAFGRILPGEMLRLPARGAFNVHPSLLPAYRGNNPIEWQILRGERTGGVTIHELVEEVDAGPIVAARSFTIGPDDDWEAIFDRAHEAAEELLAGLLGEDPGAWPRVPQPPGEAPLPVRRRRDGVVDWTRPADEIRRLVLAEGWRGWVRSTRANGGDVILEAVRVETPSRTAPPGTVLEGGATPLVAAGDGAVRLLRHRASSPLRAGERLGEAAR